MTLTKRKTLPEKVKKDIQQIAKKYGDAVSVDVTDEQIVITISKVPQKPTK